MHARVCAFPLVFLTVALVCVDASAFGEHAATEYVRLSAGPTISPRQVEVYAPEKAIPCPFLAEFDSDSANLGQLLTGQYWPRTKLTVRMASASGDSGCIVACMRTLGGDDSATKLLRRLVEQQYRLQLELDLIPAGLRRTLFDDSGKARGSQIEFGVPLGWVDFFTEGAGLRYYVNNHVDLTVVYRGGESKGEEDMAVYEIVGLEAEPSSRLYSGKSPADVGVSCGLRAQAPHLQLPTNASQDFLFAFTFAVAWRRAGPGETRQSWVASGGWSALHWGALADQLLSLLLLSSLCALLVWRRLRVELQRSATQAGVLEDEFQEETGWKLLRFDVFRAPRRPLLLALLVGEGARVCALALLLPLLGALGFFDFAAPGSLLTAAAPLWSLLGLLAGFLAARALLAAASAARPGLLRLSATVAIALPLLATLLTAVCGITQHARGAQAPSALGYVFAWLLVLLLGWPLAALGAALGLRAGAGAGTGAEAPRTNLLPRLIPPQPWYLRALPSAALGGALVYASAFVLVYELRIALFSHGVFYLWGFALLSVLFTSILAAQVCVLLCFFQLAGEDWRWWWRPVQIAAASTCYMVLDGILFFASRMSSEPSNFFLYFMYSCLLALFYFLSILGVGWLVTLAFVRHIYSSHLE